MPAPFIELEVQSLDKASFDRSLASMSKLAQGLIDQLISFDFALNTAISHSWSRASSNVFRETVLDLAGPWRTHAAAPALQRAGLSRMALLLQPYVTFTDINLRV